MFKKALFIALLAAIQFIGSTPAARADIDVPTCYPCGK